MSTTTKELFPIKAPNRDKYASAKTPHHTVSSDVTFGFYQSSPSPTTGNESPRSESPNYDLGAAYLYYCPTSPCYGDPEEEECDPVQREALEHAFEIVQAKIEAIQKSKEFEILNQYYGGELSISMHTMEGV